MCTWFWWGNLRERDHLGVQCVDGRVILKWVFTKWNVGHGMDRAGSGQRQVADTRECGNETWGFVNCEDLLTS
jgi:hypothetical protein